MTHRWRNHPDQQKRQQQEHEMAADGTLAAWAQAIGHMLDKEHR